MNEMWTLNSTSWQFGWSMSRKLLACNGWPELTGLRTTLSPTITCQSNNQCQRTGNGLFTLREAVICNQQPGIYGLLAQQTVNKRLLIQTNQGVRLWCLPCLQWSVVCSTAERKARSLHCRLSPDWLALRSSPATPAVACSQSGTCCSWHVAAGSCCHTQCTCPETSCSPPRSAFSPAQKHATFAQPANPSPLRRSSETKCTWHVLIKKLTKCN